MKARDLKQLSDSELLKRVEEEEQSLANLHFQKVTSQLENPMKLGQTRREIARMKTILHQRQLTTTVAATPQPVKEST